jgi:hypothetical protein
MAHLLELALEGEVRHVAGDDDVIDVALADRPRDGLGGALLVDGTAAEADVGPAGLPMRRWGGISALPSK